jgi:hypothetical protein
VVRAVASVVLGQRRTRDERTGIREIRTPNQHAHYDLTEGEKRELVRIYVDCWPYQGSGRYGFDATILPANARGFLAGKKRRQPD